MRSGISKVPAIPESEIMEFMIKDDLTEIERIKALLKKKNQDQQSYFFINIESIFGIKTDEFHNVYGAEYTNEKQKRKDLKHNYET